MHNCLWHQRKEIEMGKNWIKILFAMQFCINKFKCGHVKRYQRERSSSSKNVQLRQCIKILLLNISWENFTKDLRFHWFTTKNVEWVTFGDNWQYKIEFKTNDFLLCNKHTCFCRTEIGIMNIDFINTEFQNEPND